LANLKLPAAVGSATLVQLPTFAGACDAYKTIVWAEME
jgi:hypothetical protein